MKMENSKEHNLINKQILEFYANCNKFSITETRKYLCADWTLNFNRLYELYKDNLEVGLTDYKYDEYLDSFRKILPIFEGIHYLYCNAQLDLKKFNFEWLGGNSKYMLEFLESTEISETLNVEKALVLTSHLENGLANVYFVRGENCTPPHLLRDLLRTEVLCSIFGLEIMSLLRMIMGTPNAINLRNIVWHGFPNPKEIPDYYSSLLIIIIHSLGSVLKNNQMDKLVERPRAADFKILCDQVSKHLLLPSKSAKESKYIEQIKYNVWIPKEFIQYWYRLFHYYGRQQYWNFVILIIPQIEFLLRVIYAEVNDFDVAAKLDEYYITLDSIFESNVITGEATRKNKLINGDVLKEDLLKLIYDLFIAPNGPRVRDKISHGEIDIAAIDYVGLCDILFHLSMRVLLIERPYREYESIFHLNCITKNSLDAAIEQLEELTTKHLMNEQRNANDLSFIGEKRASTNIKIFNRPKKESEVNLLVLKNAKFVQTACVNYEHSIETKLKLLEQRELHSKRRRTLERMLAALPNICNTFRDIVSCLMCVFTKLQTDDSIFQNEGASKKLLGFLKHTLKLTENFAKYSKESSNEWIKAVQLCERFTDVKLQYYQKEYFE